MIKLCVREVKVVVARRLIRADGRGFTMKAYVCTIYCLHGSWLRVCVLLRFGSPL